MKTFTESVSPSVCDKLKNITYSDFKTILTEYNSLRDRECENESSISTQYKKLKKYCYDIQKSGYSKQVDYDYGKNSNGQGRLYAQEYSLQNIAKCFSGALMEDYQDFDMVNAQPTLLVDILKRQNMSSLHLNDYIANRENRIKELTTELKVKRSVAKMLFIKSINSPYPVDKYIKKVIKNDFFRAFDIEMKKIQVSLNEKYPIISQGLQKIHGEKYHQAHTLNKLYSNLEGETLSKVLSLNMVLKHTNIVPMFDGLMIKMKDNVDKEVVSVLLLKSLETATHFSWVCKSLETRWLNKVLSSVSIPSAVCDDMVEAGQFIIDEILPNRIHICESVLYIEHGGSWKSGSKAAKGFLIREIMKVDLHIKMNPDSNEETTMKVSTDPKKLVELATVIIPNLAPINDEFIDTIWNDTIGKVYFKNGYYDFDENTFINGGTNTFIRSPLEYSENRSIEARTELFDKIINPIFTIKAGREDFEERTELMRHIIQALGFMIAGRIEKKNWLLGLGWRDSGKGVIIDLLENCFGGYVRSADSENFKKKRGGDDSARGNAYMCDYQFRRICTTSEIISDKGAVIDGTKIKKFCSGGDRIEGRKLYTDSNVFKLQAGVVIFANDIPPIEPTDAYEKCIHFNMKSKFVSVLDKSSADLREYYLKDDSVKTHLIKRKDIQMEMIHLLIESKSWNAPMPAALVSEAKSDSIDDEETLIELFKSSHNGFISNDSLKTRLSVKGIAMTASKATKILMIQFNVAKGCKKNKRGLLGISFNEPEEEEEDSNDYHDL